MYLVFAVFRSNEILLQGRFFAEEGSVFWSYALSQEGHSVIQYVPVIQGYLCLNCNLQIYLSTLVPVTFSPLVTVWSSVLISFLPSFLFYRLADRDFENKYRILVTLTILFLPSLNLLEVFANSINSQVYLSISCFIILIYGLDSKKLLKLQLTILAISFLSSYYALILLPVFLLKYLITRNTKLLSVLFLGLFGSIIQINVLFYSTNTNSIYEGKLQIKGGIDYLIEIIKLSFSINIFGEKYYRDFSNNIFSFFIVGILIYLITKNKKDHTLLFIIFSYILQIFLVVFGQAGSNFSQRYSVVVSTISFFLIIHILKKYKISGKVVIFFLFVGLLNFNSQGGRYFIECDENCVTWGQQVQQVKEGSRQIYIHWPIGEGEPYWFTDAKNPQPNPAPFQKDIIGNDYIKYYDLTLVDIISSNLKIFSND
jgi:hypothetical protein